MFDHIEAITLKIKNKNKVHQFLEVIKGLGNIEVIGKEDKKGGV